MPSGWTSTDAGRAGNEKVVLTVLFAVSITDNAPPLSRSDTTYAEDPLGLMAIARRFGPTGMLAITA